MLRSLGTKKDRDPKNDKPRLPHERDQNFDRQDAARSGHKVERREIRHAYDDIREGQVDTDLHGSGGLDEMNKDAGHAAGGAPRKGANKS